MMPVHDTTEVLEAVKKTKSGASGFITNFFSPERKIQDWIRHGEMLIETNDDAALFLRKDRDFWHLDFSAGSSEALQRAICSSSHLETNPIVTDLVGNEVKTEELIRIFEARSFRRYRQLHRMAKLTPADLSGAYHCDNAVHFAESSDSAAILDLLVKSLNPYAEQLPSLREIESAAKNNQILAIKNNRELAGFLFFETQGLTSTVRYWLVAGRFRAQRLGAVLMRHYFATHGTVRRFILWVMDDNADAISKYRHYGFTPDGLVDCVMVNEMIRP